MDLEKKCWIENSKFLRFLFLDICRCKTGFNGKMTIRGKIKEEIKISIDREYLNIMAKYHVKWIVKDEGKIQMIEILLS